MVWIQVVCVGEFLGRDAELLGNAGECVAYLHRVVEADRPARFR